MNRRFRSVLVIFFVTALIVFLPGPALYGQTKTSIEMPFGSSGTRVQLSGALLRGDTQTLSIRLSDTRVIRFRLTDSTSFEKDNKPVVPDALHIADLVKVESTVDDHGYLVAQAISFQRLPTAIERSEILQCPEIRYRSAENVIYHNPTSFEDRKLSAAGRPEALTDPDSNDHPTLRRGRPAATRKSALSMPVSDMPTTFDPVIAEARDVASKSLQSLPDFRAHRVTSLFVSSTEPIKWVPEGVLTADISFRSGQEHFEHVRLNGSGLVADTSDLSEPMELLGKAYNSGEFGLTTACVLLDSVHVNFTFVREEQRDNEKLLVYDLSSDQHSPCAGLKDHSQIVYARYRGVAKLRFATKEIVSLQIEAIDVPASFTMDRAEQSIDLDLRRIGTAEHLVTITSFWSGCRRNSYDCFMNRSDFDNYRHFEADSSIHFEPPK